MKTRPEVRWALMAACLLLPAAAAPERPLPLDAAGNIRVAEAPYEPRTRLSSSLQIDGIGTIVCRFSAAAESVPVIEQRLTDRTGRLTPNNLPGIFRPEALQFEAGIEALAPLLRWFQDVKEQSLIRLPSPDGFRRDAVLTLTNPEGQVVARFRLTRAWPSRVEWSSEDRVSFRLTANEVRLDVPLR